MTRTAILVLSLCALPALASAQPATPQVRSLRDLAVQDRPSAIRASEFATLRPVERIRLSGECVTCTGPVVTYYVKGAKRATRPSGPPTSSSSEPAPDGTVNDPFMSVSDALSAAVSAEACSVSVVLISVRPQTRYSPRPWLVRRLVGNLDITRPTTIRTDPPFLVPAVIEGRISNVRGCALALQDLKLDGAQRYAIRQAGGELSLQGVTVSNVRFGPGDSLGDTAAIQIGAGAVAVLSHVSVRDGQVPGIRVTGAGTRAYGSHLQLLDNHPDLSGQTWTGSPPLFDAAALQVSDGARLWSESLLGLRNAYTTVDVARGAAAHLRSTHVESTTATAVDASGTSRGGFNIAVRANATLVLQDFTSKAAARVGLHIWDDSRIMARQGVLRENLIGLVVGSSPAVDLDACFDEVEAYDNVVDVQVDVVPIPSASDVLEGVTLPDTSNCAVLPWSTPPG